MPRNTSQVAKIRAKSLRRKMTLPERLLWSAMRKRNFGYKVRRQHPVDRFTLDFFIPDAMICVEVDGQGHELREEYDAYRDAKIREAGITTVRVSAAAVLRNAHEVAYSISMSIKERLANIAAGDESGNQIRFEQVVQGSEVN